MSKKKFIVGQECFDALAAGKILIENQGHNIVYLDSDGEQVMTNPRRSKPYKFDNENTWSISKDIGREPENKLVRLLKDIFWTK